MNKKHKICSTNILRNIQDPKFVKVISTSGGTKYVLIDGNAGKLYLLRSITVAYASLTEDKYEKALKNFLQLSNTEFKSLQQLNSIESCVRTIEFDHIEGKAKKQATCDLLMDYPGELLSDLIKETFNKNTLIKWGIQLCKGIKSAEEKGISHLNLRLDNIYIDSSKNIKITGFSATQKLYSYLTKNPKKETVDFNNIFRPPESIATSSGGSDVYSIGMILYILLKGSLKPQGKDLNTCKLKEQDNLLILKEVDGMKETEDSNNDIKNLKQIVKDCLEFNPTKRPNINQLLILFQAELNQEKEEQKKVEKILPLKPSQSESKSISNSEIVNLIIQLLEKKCKYVNVTPSSILPILETIINEKEESKLSKKSSKTKDSQSDDDKAIIKDLENKIKIFMDQNFILEDKLKKSETKIIELSEKFIAQEKEKNKEIEKIQKRNQSDNKPTDLGIDQARITSISRLAKTVLPLISTSDPVEITKKLVEEINSLKRQPQSKIDDDLKKDLNFNIKQTEEKRREEVKINEAKASGIIEEKTNTMEKIHDSETQLTDEINAILKQDEKWSFKSITFSTFQWESINKYLKRNKMIHTLYLWNCNLTDENIRELSENLSNHKQLENLDLGSNNLSSKILNDLNSALSTNLKLKYLDLETNKINDDNIETFGKIFEKCENFQVLNLRGNDVSDKSAEKFLNLINVSESAAKVYLSGNNVSIPNCISLLKLSQEKKKSQSARKKSSPEKNQEKSGSEEGKFKGNEKSLSDELSDQHSGEDHNNEEEDSDDADADAFDKIKSKGGKKMRKQESAEENGKDNSNSDEGEIGYSKKAPLDDLD